MIKRSKYTRGCLLLITILLAGQMLAKGSADSTEDRSGLSISAYPYAYYTPETQLAEVNARHYWAFA